MIDQKLLDLIEEGVAEAARGLVRRIKNGEFSAADVAQLRSMAKDLGLEFRVGSRPTPLGDEVLESLLDVDPSLFKN